MPMSLLKHGIASFFVADAFHTHNLVQSRLLYHSHTHADPHKQTHPS
jgi:hypothetical protein